jgi:hypothetical protein
MPVFGAGRLAGLLVPLFVLYSIHPRNSTVATPDADAIPLIFMSTFSSIFIGIPNTYCIALLAQTASDRG